jgi:DNA-binding PadR family transcriptional regulator
MPPSQIPLLGYALLGLIQQRPSSGYDLLKIFSETPMAGYSDSPGAIYPALRRLEDRKLVSGKVVAGTGLRVRKVLTLTPAGSAALTRWLAQPVELSDLANRLPELMLRFAFLEGVAGRAATLRFLLSFQQQVVSYIPSLQKHLQDHASQMPLSGRLALENGILGYQAQLQWASHAIQVYTQEEKAQ